MGSSDNRLTQINMLALARGKSPTKVTERAVLYNSLRSTPKDGSRPLVSDTMPGQVKAQSKTTRAVTSDTLQLRATWESPWVNYKKVYDIELGGPVQVAVRKAPLVELVHLQHQSIVTALEAFTTDTGLYVILEHMPISLEWIVKSPAYPDDRQLAAILGQVVAGVAYLAREGFEHGSLTCSNILLNTDGDVKIANQECSQLVSQPKGEPRDIRALSLITMELMQKYVKEDGAIGVDNLHRWPSHSDALGFLSTTASVASAEELLKHPLLNRPYQKDSLVGIISLAQVCTRGRYKYIPRK